MIDYNNGELIRRGRIEVVCGSMFSGKTEELIRRMKRAQFAQQKVEIFKPAIDTRYSDDDVVTHEGVAIHSTPVDNSSRLDAVVAATGAWLEYHAMSLGLLLKHYIRFNVSHPDILLVICRARHFYLLVMTVYAGSAVYMLRLVSRYLFVSLIDLIKDGRIRIG